MANTETKETAVGFEDTLWAITDKLRGTVDASEYKHVVLGLLELASDKSDNEQKTDE